MDADEAMPMEPYTATQNASDRIGAWVIENVDFRLRMEIRGAMPAVLAEMYDFVAQETIL